MSERADLVVVGAGVVGLGAALAGLERGMRVLVVERRARATGASVRNFGHLCFTPQVGLARALAVTARERWLRLAHDAGLSLRASGTLVVARHDDELALLAALAARREGETALGGEEVRLLDAAAVRERAPVAGAIAGGAHLPLDAQVDPRTTVAQLAAHLERRGVRFRWRTAALDVREGLVRTSRSDVEAGTIVVATNHDVDELLPEVAELADVQRCSLDMLRVRAPLPAPLAAPLLTGWSLVRYRAFADLPEAAAVRRRLHDADPELAALDVNHMHTQLPDGTLLVGDTHERSLVEEPFLPEAAAEALLRATRELFGLDRLEVVERWRGVYASGRDELLVEEPVPGVLATLATTGIGMTCGLGLAEHAIAAHLEGRPLPGGGARARRGRAPEPVDTIGPRAVRMEETA